MFKDIKKTKKGSTFQKVANFANEETIEKKREKCLR